MTTFDESRFKLSDNGTAIETTREPVEVLERKLISRLIPDPASRSLAENLQPSDFASRANGEAFRLLMGCSRDAEPTADELLSQAIASGTDDLFTGLDTFDELIREEAAGDVAGTVEQIREAARRRQLSDELNKALDAIEDTTRSVDDVLSAAKFDRIAERSSSFRMNVMSASELAGMDLQSRFLIDDVLVAGQNMIVAGPGKSLKTSVMLDLALSLATGEPFLGNFEVPEPVKVLLVSGESGLETIRFKWMGIAERAGYALASVPNLFICEDLPLFTNDQHVRALASVLRDHQPEVLIVDPAYLCMMPENPGSQFEMGGILRTFQDVARTHNVTPIIVHHTKKGTAQIREPLEREDITGAGFAEFARQWILLNRRERLDEDNPGFHQLWMSYGGSVGHGGLIGLDIDEGEFRKGFPRKWEVSIAPASSVRTNAAEEKAEARDQQKEDKARRSLERHMEQVRRALAKRPEGECKSELADLAGMSRSTVSRPLVHLVESGEVVRFIGRKEGGNRDVELYRFAETDKRTGTDKRELSACPDGGLVRTDSSPYRGDCPPAHTSPPAGQLANAQTGERSNG